MTKGQIGQLLLAPSTFEEADRFRGILRQVLYAGFRWAGIAGALGLLLYVGTEILALKRPITWIQDAGRGVEGVVIAEDLVLFALCGTAVLLPSFSPTLAQGRVLGALGTVVGAGVFLRSDLAQGTMVEVEFIVLLYLLVVVVVPFRPWQALAVGVGVGTLFLLLTELRWTVPAESPEGLRLNHHALGLGASLGLGLIISTVLYATRLAQYRVSRMATRALQEERDRFETLFDSLPTPVVHGRHENGSLVIEDVNAAFESSFGCREDQLRGTSLSSLSDESEGQEHPHKTCRQLAENPQKTERKLTTTEGLRDFQIDTTVRSSGNGDSEVYRIYTDITDRKRREQKVRQAKKDAEMARAEAEKARAEAEEASRMKSAMLANMSHEIRTPLTSIIGFAEAIEEEIGSSDSEASRKEVPSSKLREFANLIEKSGRRLLDTLDGVLNLSKLKAGQMNLARKKVNLTEEVEALIEEFRPQAEEAKVDCRAEVGEQPVPARVDEGGVQIVLSNLISNAIKYTESGGDVRVRAYRKEEAAVLEVEDTGIGMDSDALNRLFQPFRQESEGWSREHEGTGIGLAVTKEVVKRMGGEIEVNTEKGKGTCVVVRLPTAENDSTTGNLENAPTR